MRQPARNERREAAAGTMGVAIQSQSRCEISGKASEREVDGDLVDAGTRYCNSVIKGVGLTYPPAPNCTAVLPISSGGTSTQILQSARSQDVHADG